MQSRARITPQLIRAKKALRPITFVTAYDFPTARLADGAGIDMILVGDTLAEVVLGHETTLGVTFEAMLHHTRAARRAVSHALLVADLPYGSYHVSKKEAMKYALRFIKQGGAQAVKLEGGRKRADLIQRLADADVPIMGHIGLTPQSVHQMGGYRVQGRREEEIEALIEDALALDGAGVFAMVLEGIPREVAKVITETVSAPTIGIGAGPDCDGQVLVLNDLIGLTFTGSPKFVHQYANVSTITSSALQKFKIDVESGTYPGDSEATHLPADLVSELGQIVKRVRESYKENQRS